MDEERMLWDQLEQNRFSSCENFLCPFGLVFTVFTELKTVSEPTHEFVKSCLQVEICREKLFSR